MGGQLLQSCLKALPHHKANQLQRCLSVERRQVKEVEVRQESEAESESESESEFESVSG